MQPKTTCYNTIIVFLLTLMSSSLLQAQQRCATTEALQYSYTQNTELQQKVAAQLAKLRHFAQQHSMTKQSEDCDDLLVIPVVVHVLFDPHPDASSTNISETQILSQICQLNVDFGGKNEALLEGLDNDALYDLPTPIAEAASRGNCIRFALATHHHPQDELLNPESLQNGDYAIVRRSLEGLPTEFGVRFEGMEGELNDPWEISPIWNREEYLNFWVVPTIMDRDHPILGVAQYPEGAAATDGVVIRASSFGSESGECGVCGDCELDSNYNQGKTATHEVGHWLGLLHPWGHIQEECEEDDNIGDTPLQAGPFIHECNGSFTAEGDSCTHKAEGGVMYMNYMDYSADDCLILFSKGQAIVMEATLTEGTSMTGFRSRFGETDLEDIKCPYSFEVASGISAVLGTADKPLQVCGNEDFFEMHSQGPFHYDATRQAIAWGVWVIEDGFQQTGIPPEWLPGNPPNDEDISDDVNFQADYIQMPTTYGEGTVQLPVWGEGATYFLAPMVVNLDGSPVEQCGAVSLEGTYVQQSVPMSSDVRLDVCSDSELYATIYFNGGLPYSDGSERDTVSMVNNQQPNVELIPESQQHPLWVDAVYLAVEVGSNYTLSITDANGCQTTEQLYIAPDCWVDEWKQGGEISGPPTLLLLDDDNRASEAVDDFQVGAEGMTIDVIEVGGSFGRVGKRSFPMAEMVQVKISADNNGQPALLPLFEAEITPLDPSNPNFHLPLAQALQLPAGKYWLGVIPKMYFGPYKHQWFWNATPIESGQRALFRDVTNLLQEEEPYHEWQEWNSIGDPDAKNLSFTLLSEAKAGTVTALEEVNLCCEENLSFQIEAGDVDCTSYRMAWALAKSDAIEDIEAAIEAGRAWFTENGGVYDVLNDCSEDWERGAYTIVPFLANKYKDAPQLLNGCSIGGEGVEIQLLNPISVDVQQLWNGESNSVEAILTITGGMSEVDGSAYQVVLDNGTMLTDAAHGVPVVLKGLESGELIVLEVADGNGCMETWTFTDIDVEKKQPLSFVAQASPVEEVLYVQFSTLIVEEINLILFNLKGQQLIQQSGRTKVGNNQMEVPLASLPSGVYVIVIEHGGEIAYQKVFKQ